MNSETMTPSTFNRNALSSALKIMERILGTEIRLVQYIDSFKTRLERLESRLNDVEVIMIARNSGIAYEDDDSYEDEHDERLYSYDDNFDTPRHREYYPELEEEPEPEPEAAIPSFLTDLMVTSTLSYEPEHPENCAICLNRCSGLVRTLRCGHAYHAPCIETWALRGNYTCCMCRRSFKRRRRREIR